jgi:hypothetical protein
MKYAVEMGSGAVTYIQKLMSGMHSHTDTAARRLQKPTFIFSKYGK